MARLELLDFQQKAADQLVESALTYYETGPDRLGGRAIPFVGQLKAVTGAGKTPILATVAGHIGPAIVLWTTKYGSVVDQTLANLRPGGKYHHLLGTHVEVTKLSDIPSSAHWQRILAQTEGLTVLLSTVAAWNSSERDERLNVHRVSCDWGDKSRWDQLKSDRRRPLWVVYDEGHNTTTEQVDLLDDLEPAGFFVASASSVRGKLHLYQSNWSEEIRKQRIVPVSTRAVVDAQLLKSTIALADYDSSSEDMLADVVAKRERLAAQLVVTGSPTVPKSIYVVETSNVGGRREEPRPVSIWKTLVNRCGVDPASIAVCTNTSTRTLPRDAIKVETIDGLSDQHTHIIFNKKLQEGWDDPSVYLCYFDGKTDSATRIQQVLGRALRQPAASHFDDEDLNTAYFYVNCPNEALERITDQLKEELRIYKDAGDDDFEPFQFKDERRAPAVIPVKPEFVDKLQVPKLQLSLPLRDLLPRLIRDKSYQFGDDDRAAPGRALVNVVSVRTGEVRQDARDLLEDMRVRCGTYLQEQIRILSKNCANSIPPATFTSDRLNLTACYHSPALEHYAKLASEVVNEYENHVRLTELADPVEALYTVGPYQPSGTVPRDFDYAGHPSYDSKAFNDDELAFAKALDDFSDYVWVRNKDRINYGLPLPMKSGSSSSFYPDFLWWVKGTVWALDPTGRFILDEKIRSKLLSVPAPLRIALVTRGRYDHNYQPAPGEGWTLVRHRMSFLAPEPFENLHDLLTTLVAESAP